MLVRGEREGVYFSEDDTRIRIFDYGCHAGRVDGEEGRLLELGRGVDMGFVRDGELGEEEGDFPWVGARLKGVSVT